MSPDLEPILTELKAMRAELAALRKQRPDALLSAKGAAELLDCSERFWWDLVHEGVVAPGLKVKNLRRWTRDQVLAAAKDVEERLRSRA